MRKISIIYLVIFACLISIQANAVTQEEISGSIMDGIIWLVGQQNDDGSWSYGEKVASTAFALVKLEDLAYERGKSPFDEGYEYSHQIIDGLDYIFSQADQYEGVPGICFGKGHNVSYSTGITMMAIAAGRDPDRIVSVGSSIVNNWTYRDVLQANIEFYESYQEDGGSWPYEPFDLRDGDNSITGYVVLGLAYAEEPLYGFNCSIPEDLKIKLNTWIDQVQVDGDTPHNGGSGYGSWDATSNMLRAGNLIFEMAFVGDTPSSLRMQRALAFLGRAWNDPDWLWEDIHSYPGWYGNPDWAGEPYKEEMPVWWQGLEERWGNWDGPSFQAMYCLMKGLTYAGIDTINVAGSDVKWYEAFAERILFGQNEDGSWDRDYWGDAILATEWALLTLEAIAPPEQFIDIFMDIKPGSCPNPLNPTINGVLPVAVLGTEELDVYTIDPSSITLSINGNGESVAPLRWAFEDVATIFTGELCDCHDYNGDGYMDLTLKFKTQELVNNLGLDSYGGGTIPLTLNGKLMRDYGGTFFSGKDCVRILQ